MKQDVLEFVTTVCIVMAVLLLFYLLADFVAKRIGSVWGERKRLQREREFLQGYEYAASTLRRARMSDDVLRGLERHIASARVGGMYGPFETGISACVRQVRLVKEQRDHAKIKEFQANMELAAASIRKKTQARVNS